MSEEKKQKEKGSSQLFLIKPENFAKDKFQDTKFFGFFLQISEDYIPFEQCLLTHNQAVNEDYLKTKKEIKIEYNGSEKVIDLTKERKIFYNETLGYTCIEILKDEDNIEYDNLLK